MKFLLMFVLMGGMAMAQEAQKPALDTGGLVGNSIPMLTDEETLKSVKILRRLADLRSQFTALQVQLEGLRVEIVEARKLDKEKFTVNWDTGKVLPITQYGEKQAGKPKP